MPQHIKPTNPLTRKASTIVSTRVLTSQLANARKQLALRGYTMSDTIRAAIMALDANDGDAALVIVEDLLALFGLPDTTTADDLRAAVEGVLDGYTPSEIDAANKIEDVDARERFLARRKARRAVAAKPVATKRLAAAPSNDGYQPTRAEKEASASMTPDQRTKFYASRAKRAVAAAELEASRAQTKARRAAYEKNRAALTVR